MKLRIIAVAVGATLVLGGCSKTENTNISVNETALTADNMSDMNDAMENTGNASNSGSPMQGDLTHP